MKTLSIDSLVGLQLLLLVISIFLLTPFGWVLASYVVVGFTEAVAISVATGIISLILFNVLDQF